MNLNQHKRILCFFAHPDDEILATGATIHKFIKLGAEVHIAIPASMGAEHNNQQDCKRAMEILGVKWNNVYLGNFPDNAMDTHPLLKTIQWLENIISRVSPTLIFTHHRFCTNIDHQICHNATVVATRPTDDNRITVLCGEIPSSTGYLRPAQWEPNCYIKILPVNLEAKTDAMSAYTKESRWDPHPRSKSNLEALARVRGSDAMMYYAEAFMVGRMYHE